MDTKTTPDGTRNKADLSLDDIHSWLNEHQQIAIIWSAEDVQSIRPDLTDDQAWEVLQRCEWIHDCETGLNWRVIEYVADEDFPNPTED